MAPPPATPTPRRFLVSKRPHAPSETPSAQQFRATPRFSLSSTPRTGPSSSLTPFGHRGTGRDVVIDSSPPPFSGPDHVDHDDGDSVTADEGYGGGRVVYEQDPVVDADDVVQESSPIYEAESDSEDRSWSEARHTKRRRVSVSPPSGIGIEKSSPPEIRSGLDVEMRDAVLDIDSSFPDSSISGDDEPDSDDEVPGDGIDNIGGASSPHLENQTPRAHQPMFQRAPRFKPAELPEGAPRPEPLPEAFSPRRKGAKYIQGGLAAELRDWLVDVEAGIGSGSISGPGARADEDWVMKIRVDSLRGTTKSARGMTLVLGSQVLDEKNNTSADSRSRCENEEAVDVPGETAIRLMLAGPGRLSGLGVGNDVSPGVLLGIARPTWEVVLDDLGRWGVACDWVVLH